MNLSGLCRNCEGEEIGSAAVRAASPDDSSDCLNQALSKTSGSPAVIPNHGLFDAVPEINQWMPDETLYSLASRYHWLLGSRRPDETCRALFGHHRSGSSHEFPAFVDEFAARTSGALGDSRSIILERTLLSFYFPFRSSTDASNAVAAVRVSALGSLKGRLGCWRRPKTEPLLKVAPTQN